MFRKEEIKLWFLSVIIAVGFVGLLSFLFNKDKNLPIEKQISDKEILIQPTITEVPTPEPTKVNVPTIKPTATIPPLKTISFSGFAYEDRNNDGAFNSDDIKLPNMQFLLFDAYSNQQVSTVFSDANGVIELSLNVRKGIIIKPTAYNNFTPKTGNKTISTNSNGLEFGFRSASTPIEGSNVGLIEGDVFFDLNRNGNRDEGENGIYFYKLYLIDSKGNYYNTVENAQATDPGGHFKFVNLKVDDLYQIVLSNPTGDYEVLRPSTPVSLPTTRSSVVNIQIPVFKY